jgi:hypothetical protein
MPKMKRPPESWSRLAIALAVAIGSCCGTSRMPVPTFSLFVAAAAKAGRRTGRGCGNSAWAARRRREGRLAAERDVGVLGHEQRIEAAVLQRLGQLGDVDAVVGRK